MIHIAFSSNVQYPINKFYFLEINMALDKISRQRILLLDIDILKSYIKLSV